MGPIPSIDDDLHNVPDLTPDPDDNNKPIDMEDFAIEEGNHIFAVQFHDKPEHIRTMQNVSTRLAKALHKNSKVKAFHDTAPAYLHDFEDIFSKELFDVLPDRKVCDHVIELTPDAENKSCKVYPLSVAKQAELDKFLEENLASGRIRLSKLPMALPFFFVKKKDGTLRPILLPSLAILPRHTVFTLLLPHSHAHTPFCTAHACPHVTLSYLVYL